MTKLIRIIPTKAHGAEVKFIRTDNSGKKYTIYACRCYEGWEQWGAKREILGDNVSAVEQWWAEFDN